MKSKKLIVSLVLAIAVIVLFGTMSSYAAEITASSNTAGQITITPSANTATNRVANSTGNTSVINSTVNTYSNSSTGSAVNKTPVANSSSTKIPYAGAGSIAGAFVIVVILLGSSIFAYKKVSEYNV